MGLEALLAIQQAPSSRSTIVEDTRSSGTAYSGVILMLPLKPPHELVPPVRADELHLAGALAKPIVIPFDGAYWYFKRPDARPKPDARSSVFGSVLYMVDDEEIYWTFLRHHFESELLFQRLPKRRCRFVRVKLCTECHISRHLHPL